MGVTPAFLYNITTKAVAEVRFDRRIIRSDAPPFRRMLCTNDMRLLNTPNGKDILKYVPPKNFPPYNPSAYNLIITWDIFCCWWRCVSCESAIVVRTIPTEYWWDYFDEFVRPMTAQQKIDFMQS